MKTVLKDSPKTSVERSCKSLLDHLASELAKEYVKLIRQSAEHKQNIINIEKDTCVLLFTPATVQKASAKKA